MKGDTFKDKYWDEKLQIYWAGYNGCEYIAYKGSHQIFEYPTWEYPSPPSRIIQHNERIESEDDFESALDSREWYTAHYTKSIDESFNLDFTGDSK
ncbi:hypothetical protein JOC34_000582 [Virgibacillus halotolerans]|uniref:hypothetical protein n=1 Tax=Virgibacillus halotolerans TaxID=1071053 RepID=UPI001962052D|nr:hypothetical protein [Virgibacillus halotolerans]MBM7598225.1 hypothetical protein [Virgibacillus halotolerans]